MSLPVLIAALALVLVAPQEKSEAETLFLKMEEKVVKAKTFRAKLAGALEERKFTLTGDVKLDEGSKVRVDIEGKDGEAERKATVICDGKKVQFKSSDKENAETFDVPDTFGKLMRIAFCRAGWLSSLRYADNESRAKTNPDEAFAVSAFKLEAKEKVGDREAQAVGFTVTVRGRDASATVWIDVATHLPLKRVLKVDSITFTESYTEVKVDEKIDPSTFEIPKETK